MVWDDRRDSAMHVSSFLLCLASPVLRKMVCGKFLEGASKRICLNDVIEVHIEKLLRVACGSEEMVAGGAQELLDLAELADRLQMETVIGVIEEALIKALETGVCAEMFRRSEAIEMRDVQAACYKMMLQDFEAVSLTDGMLHLSEDVLGGLLENEELSVKSEEILFAAVVKWMMGGKEGLRGHTLLGKIRYGLIDDGYLADSLVQALPGHEELQQLVGEAIARKQGRMSGGVWDGVQRLCDEWNVPRGRNFGSNVLKRPAYVAVDGRGHTIVTDEVLDEVLVFSCSGSVVRRFGSKGTAEGQFQSPRGVAVDRQGHIVVADSGNHRIQVLSADGTVVRCFGSNGRGVGQLNCPQGVAIDSKDHIVVADNGNHRIQKFDAEGSVHVVAECQFPGGVAVDEAGRIVVADTCNNRVQVFNSDGSVALRLGATGKGPGQFFCPTGVAADKEGRFVIADYGNSRVQIFNADGTAACVMGGEGADVGQLSGPWGVAVGLNGRILVADSRNCRVSSF